MRRRALSWSAALRDLKADRAARPEIREERLRLSGGLRCGVELSAWRGRSGRRYVVRVHPVADAAAIDPVEAVILAVARDDAGAARLIDAAEVDPRLSLADWAPKGATELHVHRFAVTPRERAAVVEDLTDGL